MKSTLKLLILLFFIPLVLNAADWDRMKTNIRVQEKILNAMLEDSPDFWLMSNAEGIYIPEFGAVFSFRLSDREESAIDHMYLNFPGLNIQGTIKSFSQAVEEYELQSEEASDSLLEEYQEEEENQLRLKEIQAKMEKHSKKIEEKQRELDELSLKLEQERAQQAKEMEESFHKKVDKLNSLLKEYIADYSPALNLPAGERILLRGELETMLPIDDNRYTFEFTSGESVEGLKKGESKVIIRKLNNGDELPTDIRIMKNILNTAFEDRNKDRFIFCLGASGDEAWSTYIPGFGALFYRSFSLGSMVSLRSLDPGEPAKAGSKKESDITIVLDSWDAGSSPEKNLELLNTLEDEISDLLVVYTPTLKSVKLNESVVIAVKVGDFQSKSQPGSMILKLPKKAVDNAKNDKEVKDKIVKLKI